MKQFIAAAIIFGIGLTQAAFAEEMNDGKVVVFAADSNYIFDNGKVVDLGVESFIYQGSSYVPVSAAVGALAGTTVLEDDIMKITYKDKSIDIPVSDMKNYDGVYYISARALSDNMGVGLQWNDGIVILSENNIETSELMSADYKAKLRYDGYKDRYDEELYRQMEKEVDFSVKGGFYTESQVVELSTNLRNASIYYTTDGSDPAPWSPSAKLYTEPIVVENVSWADNVWSNITTVVNENFEYPKGSVMKGTCIKARAFNNEEQTTMSVNSYYIAEDMFTRYGVKVFSITANPQDLFDEQSGIYSYNNSIQQSNWRECTAFMEVFDEQGERVINQSIGLRLNGAGTRKLQQKALRVYARESEFYEKGDKKKFKYDFFNGTVSNAYGEKIEEYKRLILRNAGDDWSKYFMRDVLVHDICRNIGIDTQGYVPAVVFLNGEYWGVHQVRERYDNKYFEEHYKLASDDDAVLIEIANHPMYADINEGTDQDLQDFNDKAYFIINNDMSVQENYIKAQEYFDIGNMIDYYIMNIFFENVDWPQNNVKIWRNKNPENTAVDTRYRFVISDEDTTCEDNGDIYADAYGPKSDIAAKWKNSSGDGTLGYKLDDAECLVNVMLHSLMANNEFEIEFIRRYNDHLNTIFRSWSVKGHIDNIYNGMIGLRAEHVYRYPQSWKNSSVDALKKWADERPSKARKEIKNYFGYSDMVNVTFISDQNMGHIDANSLTISPWNNKGIENVEKFSAPYYKDIPLWIRAVPNAGYVFDHFTVNGQVWYDDEAAFNPMENIVIEAHFRAI